MIELIQKYSWMIIGGVVGAIIDRLRKSMSWKRFFSNVFIAAFVGLCTGISVEYLTDFPKEVQFVCVSISGYMAQYLLDEVKEIVDAITTAIKERISNYKKRH